MIGDIARSQYFEVVESPFYFVSDVRNDGVISPAIESLAMSSTDGIFTSISENDISWLNTENPKIKGWNLESKRKLLKKPFPKPLRQKIIVYSSSTKLGT